MEEGGGVVLTAQKSFEWDMNDFFYFLYQDIRIHSADLGILGTEVIKSSDSLDSLILGVQ